MQAAITKRTMWMLSGLLLAAAALRILWIAAQGFWFDELFGVYYARFPLAEMYRGIALEGTKMPLFYTLIHALLPPAHIELILRLLAAACGLLSIAVLYRLVLRLISGRPNLALWAVVLLAVNPFHMHYSREARPYTLMLLLALLAMWGFVALTTRGRRGWWLVLGVSHALLFITNLFGLIVPFVQFIFLATHLRRHSRLLRRWMITNALAVIPLVLWYAFMIEVNSGQLRFAASWFPLAAPPDLLYTLWNFTLGYLPQMLPLFAIGLLLLGALAVFGARWLLHHRLVLPLLWLLPMLLVWLVGTRRPLYGDRYMIVMLPALMIMIAAGISAVTNSTARRLVGAAVVGAMLVGCWQIVFNPENRREEWRDAAALVAREQRAGEAIYFTELNAAISFGFYYAATPAGDGTPLPIRLLQPDTAIRGEAFWLVIGYAEFSPHRLGQPYLMDWAANRSAIEAAWHIPPEAEPVQVDVLAGVVVVRYQFP